MNCEYSFIDPRHDGIDNFISSVNHYSKNPGCLLAEAFRELSLYAYKWLLNHFNRKKAHRIHHNVICHSLFWLAFVKAYWDRSKPGHHKYDSQKMARNLAKGHTTMIRVRDPIEYEGKVFATLGQLFDDVRHQKLAVGIPCHPDYSKQEGDPDAPGETSQGQKEQHGPTAGQCTRGETSVEPVPSLVQV